MNHKFDFNSIINEEIHRIRNSNVFHTDFQSTIMEGDDIDITTTEGQTETLVARERISQLLDETINLMEDEYKTLSEIDDDTPSAVNLVAKVDVIVEFLKDQKRAINKLKFDV